MAHDDPTVQSDVLLTERIGNVLVLTLNRPEARNALDPGLKDRLTQQMREADADPGIRAVVITGNGPVFCAGMDLKAFAQGADFGGLAWLYKEGISGTTLSARIPLAVALEFGLTGEFMSAQRAREIGLFRSGDAMEGARAFAERRTPVWTGK